MRRDFNKYFVQVQKNYNEMNKILEKVNKELSEGKCTNEQRDQLVIYFNQIEVNYDRLSYVKHLLSLPPKPIQWLHNKRLELIQRNFEKKFADANSVVDENNLALENIKAISDYVDSEGSEGVNE